MVGRQSDNGSDELNFTARVPVLSPSVLVTLACEETGFEVVSFSGIETLNVDAGAFPLVVDADGW